MAGIRLEREDLWKILKEGISYDENCKSNKNEENVNVHISDKEKLTTNNKEVINKQVQHLDSNAKSYLKDIRKFASYNGEYGVNSLKKAKLLFLEEYPTLKAEVNSAEQSGIHDKKLYNKSYKAGKKNKNKEKIKSLINNLSLTPPSFVVGKIWDQYYKGLTVYSKISEEKENKKNNRSLSSVQLKTTFSGTMANDTPLTENSKNMNLDNLEEFHPNDIRSLNPHKSWHLVIDETGTDFSEEVNSARKSIGRFVGLLVPGSKIDLPKLKSRWHAVDESNAEIDRVLQTLLNSNVGILGLDVRSLPITRGERWLDGIALLIDWVLRLIPVNDKCDLNVFIEQRGSFDASQPWDVIRRDCLRRLALAYTYRASNIGLTIQTITKTGHEVNGYTDAVAYTWAQTSKSSKERLRNSKLMGTCLLDSTQGADARSMLYALDSFKQGINIAPSAWWDLLQSRDASNSSSIMTSFLKNIGLEAKNSLPCWNGFLKEVKNRMAVTTLSIHALSNAVAWLQLYQPNSTSIPPVMRLAWLTVQLAQANHMGETENNWENELEILSKNLFDEIAPFVCQADLNRAVAATNRFDFTKAANILSKWQYCKPSEPGLCYWGQLQSSYGQHSAFQNDNDKAILHFNKALTAFRRLSDQEIRDQNLSQTKCYLAIAKMDSHISSLTDIRSTVEEVIGNLPEAAIRLAESENPIDRYAHHLLLRWLVYRGDAITLNNYLSKRENWSTGQGHPWELILLYRGILLHPTEPDAAVNLVLEAANIAFDSNSGPTVNYIGACCKIVASIWGTKWNEKGIILQKLKEQLPAAEQRVSILERCNDNVSPVDFLKEVLPFNFR